MIRIIFKILGLFFLAMALITAVLDITRSIADSSLIVTSLGLDWFNFSKDSLIASQNLVQRFIHPLIWDPLILPILQAPSWIVFGAVWLLLWLATRSRQNRFESGGYLR